MKYFAIMIFAAAVVIASASSGAPGDYHVSGTLLCYDCHTMHFSMQHGWDGGAVSGTFQTGGSWLSANGPNHFLLKDTANNLCLGCHNGQSFAPDVVGANGGLGTAVREAGALNQIGGAGAGYEEYKGHTLGATSRPPGYNPTEAGFSDIFPVGSELECTNCHTQHGRATAYRNLGPRSSSSGTFEVTYNIDTTQDVTKDVWINMAKTWTSGVGAPGSTDYYDQSKIRFNRIETTLGNLSSSNKIGAFCSSCHADFHGGPTNTGIGGTGSPAEGFIRHPTSNVNIGALGGGHSSASRFPANTTKVKVATNDYTSYTNTTPICLTCHKAHGNQNPFGLVFLNRTAASVTEQGGWATDQTENNENGYRNLCGQCHSQGN